jgi:dTDP-4-dehydrorhamnose reductase
VKILITGASGLVGRALTEHCKESQDDVIPLKHSELDIADAAQVNGCVESNEPEVVINCAAWTDVDACESDPERSNLANAIGPENLARACRRVGALLISISTDYVFDGTKDGFYTQRDNPNPLSVYAKSKLEGERRVQESNANSIIVRTGFIFGPGGKNFLSNVVQLARAGSHLKGIIDAWGTPTYSVHLARRLRELAVLDLPGIFHVVNAGAGASFETFAREGLRVANCPGSYIEPVTMASLSRPAPRPRNSKLECLLSKALGLEPLPEWQEGLRQFVDQMQADADGRTEVF